jgi:hypothetical protein
MINSTRKLIARRLVGLATRRQAKARTRGKSWVAVTVTVSQLIRKLRVYDDRCALTGRPFWTDPVAFGPSSPSLDRIDPHGPYSDENTRIIRLGINGLKGAGEAPEEMYADAAALLSYRETAEELARRDAEARRAEPQFAVGVLV